MKKGGGEKTGKEIRERKEERDEKMVYNSYQAKLVGKLQVMENVVCDRFFMTVKT